jgi:hypothetical protein
MGDLCSQCQQEPQPEGLTLACPECRTPLEEDAVDQHFDLTHHCMLEDEEGMVCLLCGAKNSMGEHFRHVRGHAYQGDGHPLRFQFRTFTRFDPRQLIVVDQRGEEVTAFLEGHKYRGLRWGGVDPARAYQVLYERGGQGLGFDPDLDQTTLLLYKL